MIKVEGLTKRYARTVAVDNISFEVEKGQIVGFLGPNGAGKTTTLRCLLGLVRPTSGEALLGGRNYRDLEQPVQAVGAALEAASFHPGRSARDHLRVLALAGGLPTGRVDEVLRTVGMEEYADRRVGGFSLGMRQRLALAQAVIGDPGVLLLDEPANGLDPAGIVWLRGFLRTLAAEGRTVLISSHQLAEVQQTVDEVVVLSHGRLVVAGRLSDLEQAQASVIVRSPERDRLASVLVAAHLDVRVEVEGTDGLVVHGPSTDEIGHLAHLESVELHQLSARQADLEHLFLQLTGTDEP